MRQKIDKKGLINEQYELAKFYQNLQFWFFLSLQLIQNMHKIVIYSSTLISYWRNVK